MMKRINVLCEGPTEEQFVNKLLYPEFLSKNIFLTPRSLDGGFNYDRLKYEVIQWLNNDKDAWVTTMIDLYGLKGKYPGSSRRNNDIFEWVDTIEKAIETDIRQQPGVHNLKFISYLQLHEFEALLFSDPEILTQWLALDREIPDQYFTKIRAEFISPEHINNHPETAPSKRILQIAPDYRKITDGNLILGEIGLPVLRSTCQHFNTWLTKLENC